MRGLSIYHPSRALQRNNWNHHRLRGSEAPRVTVQMVSIDREKCLVQAFEFIAIAEVRCFPRSKTKIARQIPVIQRLLTSGQE